MWSRINFTKIFFFAVLIFLIILPFFWIPVGSLDLGSDNSRIYFYDPIQYLKINGLYVVLPEGINNVEPMLYFFPYLMFLAIIKFVLFNSSYLLTIAFDSIKLSVGFLAMYGIIKEFLFSDTSDKKNEFIYKIIATLGGLFYVLIPTMTGNWDRALLSHTQVFLNPLLFYLILKFFLTKNYRYLFFTLLTTFTFSINFSFESAPPFFAFFPISLFFLILYVIFIRKRKLPWKGILLGVFLFFCLQMFHLLPEVASLFDKGSFTNTRVFDTASIIHEGVEYFYGVLPYSLVSRNILLAYVHFPFGYVVGIIPLIIFLGLFFKEKTNKAILLTASFLLILIYLQNAKITDLGIKIYAQLFYIPGFSIFRNFIGQWSFVFSFFYALMFSLAFAVIAKKLSKKSFLILLHFVLVILLFSAWPFFNGELVNKSLLANPQRRIASTLDPNFLKSLAYVSKISTESKFLTLPFNDTWYQVIFGTNDGVYIGPSFLSYYAGKSDFASYHAIQPFPELLLKLARDKDYDQIKRLLSILGIHYIYYYSNPKAYDSLTPDFFGYVRQSMPKNQQEYNLFIQNFATDVVFKSGYFNILKIPSDFILPLVYSPTQIVTYYKNNNLPYPNIHFDTSSGDIRVGYIDSSLCSKDMNNICNLQSGSISVPNIYFSRVNPTRYIVRVTNITGPFILAFSQGYHSGWKLFLNSNKSNNENSYKTQKTYFDGQVAEGIHENVFFNSLILQSLLNKETEVRSPHFLINGYANGWYIEPKAINNAHEVTFTLEMTQQRLFYYGIAITTIVFVTFLTWGVYLFFVANKRVIIQK